MFIQVDAPTEEAPEDLKDGFYQQLASGTYGRFKCEVRTEN